MQLNIHITIPSLILRTDEKIKLDSSLQMCQGDNFQFHILKWGGGGGRGIRKKVPGRTYRIPAMDNCLGVSYVSCQKDLKIKHVDLGLFLASNQLMFSFVTFWFC